MIHAGRIRQENHSLNRGSFGIGSAFDIVIDVMYAHKTCAVNTFLPPYPPVLRLATLFLYLSFSISYVSPISSRQYIVSLKRKHAIND